MRVLKMLVFSEWKTLMHVSMRTDSAYSVWGIYHIALGEPWFTPNRKVENYRLRVMGYNNFTYYGYRGDGSCSDILTIEPGAKL